MDFPSIVKSNNSCENREMGYGLMGHKPSDNPKTQPNFANPTRNDGGSATIIRGTHIVR